jgi:hypothetical protein
MADPVPGAPDSVLLAPEVVPDAPQRPSRWRRLSPEAVATAVVVVAGIALTLTALQPDLLVADTTPAGGDMGAHVWGPAFLRDHLLPSGRLTGWAPDWYAGFPAYHFYMVVPSLAILALELVLPYGVAFKLVTVSGLLALPVAAWALGRLARAPFPTPALLAVAAVGFLFERSYTIYGGNIASTLAGEFAFSISLALAIVFLGLVLRGLDTGRLRALAALALGLCALCHVIPLIFAVAGAAVAVALRPAWARVKWLLPVLVGGAALSAFWTLPFVLRRAYLNDMGWEKVTIYLEPLLPGRLGEAASRLLGGEANGGGGTPVAGDLTVVAVLALLGAIASLILRRRLGTFLTVLAVACAIGFVLAPQGRLWNARLLPFWYLCLYFLAAIAVAELVEAVATLAAKAPATRSRVVAVAGTVAVAAVALGAVALPLRLLPFGQTSSDGTRYSWLGLTTTDKSFVPDWARWNYTGYERKDAWPEYQELVATMAGIGRSSGCGRAMWEYEPELDRYGTPMALMLLPYWTDGCIGSMEGLYFEASATTPYHFINQTELSAKPSQAQRDLPYGSLDVARGVDHLQLLGVRYYMATSEDAKEAADAHPDLLRVASSGPWRIYEVADAELVEPLDALPAVLEDAPDGGHDWIDAVMPWYRSPEQWDVFLAADGPSSWPRVAEGDDPERRSTRPVRVSDVTTDTDRISFRVDRPGTPVLVKSSYFPNWEATGADGPWRVAPNLMVVVPTEEQVELTYGTTGVDLLAWLVTLGGVVVVVALALRPPVRMPVPRPRPAPPAAGDDGPPPAEGDDEDEAARPPAPREPAPTG